MKKLIEAVRYDEIEGRTVAHCGYDDDRMLIVFTDGTCLALTARDDGCDGYELDFEQCKEINLLTLNWHRAAHESGVISDEEFDGYRKQKRREEIELAKKNLEWLESRQP